MKIDLYTRENCVACTYMKTLLKKANLEWNEFIIEKDISLEQFTTEYPHVDKTPFLIIDGVQYYELTVVANKFLKDGLIKV